MQQSCMSICMVLSTLTDRIKSKCTVADLTPPHPQACDLLQGLIPSKDDKDSGAISKEHYARLYVFTVMWCIGSFLELDDRMKLEEFIRKNDKFRLNLPTIPSNSDYNMFDFMVDSNGEFGGKASMLIYYVGGSCAAFWVEGWAIIL